MEEHIINREYTEEMEQSFIDYAVTTITDRALPDVRDGLKPVHRRILFGLNELGIKHDTPHKKSARIVGDVMGKYHPHGDSSIYEAMVKMSQNFSMSLPLVDGHGNFGSIDGDGAAAMRYTEARMSQVAEYMIQDLEKGVVSFVDNYDESEKEPEVLPARFPNLLINGSVGIATGMATSIPMHNPTEVFDALLYMLQEKDTTLDGLIEIIHAPDYPLGGQIINKDEVVKFYRTGYGRVEMRGVYTIEDSGYGKKNIIFTELPEGFIGSKEAKTNKIIELVNDKKMEEIMDIRDESSREGIRLVIEVRKGVNIDNFLNKLWIKTPLQEATSLQFLVLVDGHPETINVFQYFQHYIAFQQSLIVKRHKYSIKKDEKRLEIVEGLLIAHSVMDVIVDAIRNAKNAKAAKACLTTGDVSEVNFSLIKYKNVASKFNFTQNQAQQILDLKLQRLISVEVKALEKEEVGLKKNIEKSKSILNSKSKLNGECIKEAEELKRVFSTPRKCELTNLKAKKIKIEEIVSDIDLTVDRFGYASYREGHSDDHDEVITFNRNTTSKDKLLVITNFGNLFQIKTELIPKLKKKDKDRGTPIQVLCGMEEGEFVVHYDVTSEFLGKRWLFATKFGLAKIVSGTEFETGRLKVVGTPLKENDELISIFNAEIKEISIFTNESRALRLSLDKISEMKKNSKGNNLARLAKTETLELISEVEDGGSVEFKGKTHLFENISKGYSTITPKTLN